MEQDIRVIFYDLGGTFRVIRKDAAYALAARRRIAALCGAEGDPEVFFKTIEQRYDRYREWALHFYCEAPEEVLWTRFLAFDFPKERIRAAAAELTFQYRQTKGERVVTPGGVETTQELYKRGYTLGIISDLVGTREVDEWLDHDDLRRYFSTVQQSSVTLLRKPHPAIYYYAMQALHVDAEHCAFVGDNLDRDIIGAKAAGLGMTIGVEYPDMPKMKLTDANTPDAKITSFPQLLDIFPERGRVAAENILHP